MCFKKTNEIIRSKDQKNIEKQVSREMVRVREYYN